MSHASDLQLEDLPRVQQHLISKLKQAGIQSVLDLAVSIPNELAAGGEGGEGYEDNVISADKDTITELVLKAEKALVDSGALMKEFSTAAETVLGYFGFNRNTYSNIKKARRKWFEELRE